MKWPLLLLFFNASIAFGAVPFHIGSNRVSFAATTSKPFFIQDTNGNLKGIYHEYISELIKKVGLEARFDIMPMPRVLNHASKGTYDFFIGASGCAEAEGKYLEIARFHKVQVILIGTMKKIDFNQGPLVIGKATGTLCPIFTQEQEKHVKFYEYESTEQAFKMLTANRMAAICTTRELFYYELGQSPFATSNFREMTEFHHEFAISLFVNKRLTANLLSAVTKGVKELDRKKTLTSLYKKYGLPRL